MPPINSPTARCCRVPYFPRLRALALFGRRPPQRVDSLVMPASENLHMSGSCTRSRTSYVAVAEMGLCDICGMALLSHVSSSSSPSGLRPNVISDVANDLCHRNDLCLDLCRRAPWPHSQLTTRPVRYRAQRSRLDVRSRHANLEFV